MFEDAEISIPCPGCGHKTKKSIAWIQNNTYFSCEGCGRTVAFQADELLAGIENVDKTLADFRKKLGRIGKRR
ncbi:hypothetical protein RGCCGE502_09395 [Rhizobium grahamii CCGE 502]|uniref:Uncharacterized protein n=1 Tax=Rhizobium grahamii CCGE 502 TaxID=990285 RepID=S3HKQ3_9HYPH|nr:hypothetical protein RGCCGE502_09395 [Rhizobium grahamii CCGE 502]